MSEDVQHSQPRGWKAFQANYDVVFAASDRLCTVCLSQQQIQALLSQTEYLYWPSRWVKTSGEDVDKDIVTQFTEDLERQLLMACCDDQLPIQWRYTSDGVLQQSLNGGATWMDAPLYDPRVYSTHFPPIPGADGADKKCAAAASAAILVKEQVGDQLTDGMSRYTLVQLVTDWVKTMIDTSNPFLALVQIIANQIFALVIATLRPALTDDVYHKFQCALDCTMADDASFNDAQWAAARSKITSSISGIAGIFLEHLVYLLGTQGLTNLVRSGAATTGDCSDCDCDDCTCHVEWTFSGVTDVVKLSDCHYTMTKDSTGYHFSFTSGDKDIGCYYNWTGLGAYSSWGLGAYPSPNNVDPKTNQIWNFDFGGFSTGDAIDVVFSGSPFP